MSGISSLLAISKQSLQTSTQAIRILGDNISNVNNPSYSRRAPQIATQVPSGKGISVTLGLGAKIEGVTRSIDQFINAALLGRISENSGAAQKEELFNRIEAPFALDLGAGNIGVEMSEFFSSMEDLAQDPSSIPLRTNFVERGHDVAQSIRTAFQHLSDLQEETDNRIEFQVSEINRISGEIARLNPLISNTELNAQENVGLRDQRDSLLRELAEIVEYDTVEDGEGQARVALKNGFGLVLGASSRDLEFVENPTFEPVGGYPTGLNGFRMRHVVYDHDPTASSHEDVTNIMAAGAGSIGALLNIRGVQSATDNSAFDAVGAIPEIAARIEAMAADLLTRFNEEYLGPDEDLGAPSWQPSSLDLNGNPPTSPYSLFTFNAAADTNGNGLPDDLTALGFGGGVGTNIPSYAEILEFAITTPEGVHAARDLNVNNPGAPVPNIVFAPGDGSNIEALNNLREQTVDYGAIVYPGGTGIGTYTGVTNIENVYETTVSAVGSLASAAKSERELTNARFVQLEDIRAAVSGVNLDEEFAQLINFQRGFQGAARLVSTTNELLQTVLNLI